MLFLLLVRETNSNYSIFTLKRVHVTDWRGRTFSIFIARFHSQVVLNKRGRMPAVRGDGMRGLAVFISDIRNCKYFIVVIYALDRASSIM